EHVLDETRLRARVALDDREGAFDVRRDALLAERHGPSEDRVERRAELVGDGREELVLGAVRELRIGARPALAIEEHRAFLLEPSPLDDDRGAPRELLGERDIVLAVLPIRLRV